MQLVAFSLEGYRRFVKKTSVKLHGELIAFVGPNEAGKSSLLKAMRHLKDNAEFDRSELPRRSKARPLLKWHLQREEDDKEAIAGIFDADGVDRVVVAKNQDGKKSWLLEPRSPKRDRKLRILTSSALTAGSTSAWIPLHDAEIESPTLTEAFEQAVGVLEADAENFSAPQFAILDALIGLLEDVDAEPIVYGQSDEDEDEDEDEDDVRTAEQDARVEGILAERDGLVEALRDVVASERQASPWRQVVDALIPRLPSIELFADIDRQLAADYDLEEIADDPPPALGHLCSLAGLDLAALRDEAVDAAISDVATRRNAANRRLLEEFDQSWNQQGIAIQIEVQGTVLHLQATTPEDSGLSSIVERSDGMLWFAALLAFSHGWSQRPILLVDELETHLHYDAQADLIEVLMRQNFTSKVVYTTHSFGCLPPDLGTGVRVVQPTNAGESRLENGFWKSGAGFSPLLASMGAAAMSFTPTRCAVMAEGPSDAILLPTLFRQAVGLRRLPFQVAPGLSMVAPGAVALLEMEASKVAFLVDGDGGGEAVAQKLRDAGVAEERIVLLGSDAEPLEVEDLTDSDVYARAVNEELSCWNDLDEQLSAEDIAGTLRTKLVDAWCEARSITPPDKVAVAQRVVDQSPERVVAERHRDMIGEVLRSLAEILGVSLDGVA